MKTSSDDSLLGAAEPVCVADFEALAKRCMSDMGWEYMNSGVADDLTLRWNSEAYQRIRLNPRILVDVSSLDTRVTILGQDLAFPILLAPVACQKLAHPDGELATVRGASLAGITTIVSSASNTSLEDVSAATKEPLWFQLYTHRDRGFTRELVERAQTAGYRALCLTVDLPIPGARNREARVKAQLPPLPNLAGLPESKGGALLGGKSGLYSPILDPTLTWKDVEWLLSFCKVPVLVKGVLNEDDAELAIDAGVSGVVVSNHGARNLDTLPASVDALPAVVDRVAGRVPILVDGGIRRGTDVLKALALGATAVLIGRPYIWGLAAQGENGVANVVAILRREFEMAMALAGKPTIASIDRSVIWS